jgi:hypothetical protein
MYAVCHTTQPNSRQCYDSHLKAPGFASHPRTDHLEIVNCLSPSQRKCCKDRPRPLPAVFSVSGTAPHLTHTHSRSHLPSRLPNLISVTSLILKLLTRYLSPVLCTFIKSIKSATKLTSTQGATVPSSDCLRIPGAKAA